MVDGRDVAVAEQVLASVASGAAMAFADSKTVSVIGKTDGKRVILELEPVDFVWSNPAQGGIFPVRPIRQIFIDVRSVHDAEFCGYIAHDNTLVIMDGKRGVLKRCVLDEFPLFE